VRRARASEINKTFARAKSWRETAVDHARAKPWRETTFSARAVSDWGDLVDANICGRGSYGFGMRMFWGKVEGSVGWLKSVFDPIKAFGVVLHFFSWRCS
jgi:hypothetical protein